MCVPVYPDASHSSSVDLLDFGGQNYCTWNSPALASLFPSAIPCLLDVKDTLTDPAAPGFSWAVTVSSTGSVKTIGIPVDGVSPPTLVLRLNRSRGEWSGYYTAGKVRRIVVGAALTLEAFRGIGWVETGAGAAPSTARWQLSLQ